ncbi:MAG: DUF2927 domain-containing protein [Variibacter sp.]
MRQALEVLKPTRCIVRALALFVVIGMLAGTAASAENPQIAKRKAAQRTSFSDAEIARGFFRTVFGAELGLEGRVDRVRKFEKPVRVFIEGHARPDRRKQVETVLSDIGAHIPNIDIAVVERFEDANYVVHLVRDRELAATVRRMYGPKGRKIIRSLEPQCLSGFSKDAHYRIERSDVILVVDAGDFIFYDCAYEEMLQALGPIRDDATVPWTMFNDKVQAGFFDIYDQFILNILYDNRVRAGMTRKQMKALLPQILPSVREWIARKNGLPAP